MQEQHRKGETDTMLKIQYHTRQLIASWGGAKLTKTISGKYELAGGSEEDRAQAWSWIKNFAPEAAARAGLLEPAPAR